MLPFLAFTAFMQYDFQVCQVTANLYIDAFFISIFIGLNRLSAYVPISPPIKAFNCIKDFDCFLIYLARSYE